MDAEGTKLEATVAFQKPRLRPPFGVASLLTKGIAYGTSPFIEPIW